MPMGEERPIKQSNCTTPHLGLSQGEIPAFANFLPGSGGPICGPIRQLGRSETPLVRSYLTGNRRGAEGGLNQHSAESPISARVVRSVTEACVFRRRGTARRPLVRIQPAERRVGQLVSGFWSPMDSTGVLKSDPAKSGARHLVIAFTRSNGAGGCVTRR